MPKETVVVNEPIEIDEGCGEELNPGGGAFLSDAILKPRIVWMDGFGAGKYQAIGNVDLTQVANISYAESRYRFTSEPLSTVNLNPVDINPPTGSFGYRDKIKSWLHSQTGGRGGGYITTNNVGASTTGNWQMIPFPTDNTSRGGGIVIGADLLGIPLTNPLYLLNFASVNSSPSGPDIITVAINTNYTVSILHINSPLATSTITVPITGPFSIEVGLFLNTWTGGVPQPNGFIYARLYAPTTLNTGTELVRILNIQTSSSNVDTVGGIAFGSDTRGTAAIGNGIPGIRIDGVVAYDGMGSIKKYLYDTRVGSVLAFANGTFAQSTISFLGLTHGVATPLSYQNVQNLIEVSPYTAPTYNTFLNGQKDAYKIAPIKPEAVDVLAISIFANKLKWQFAQFSPGADALSESAQAAGAGAKAGYIDNGTSFVDTIDIATNSHQNVVSDFVWDAIGCAFIKELSPATSTKFSAAVLSILQIMYVSDNPSVSMVSLMGLDYVYRETIIIDEEHPPFPPVVDFVSVLSNNNHTYAVTDASVDWDGTIDGTSHTWDFGDGSAVVIGVASTSHTYVPGNYTIIHTAKDNDGLLGTKTLAIVVPNNLPVANFSFAVNLGDITGQTIDFTDSSTDSDGTIVAWDWDFGDGSAHSALQNPTHVYAAPGTCTVTLKVTDNSGGQDQVSDTVTTPIIVIPDCGLSAAFLANTAFVQGDDYNGGNPPLPAYANTAAYQGYYLGTSVFREAYDSAFSGASDGTNYIIDAVNTFNGHKTVKMGYGKPAATSYFGGSWNTVFTDDADPTEVYYTAAPFGPLAQWFWLRLKADAGVMSDAGAVSAFTGLGLIEINGRNFEVAVMNRQGHIKVDISHCTVLHGAFTTDTFDLGLDSVIFGSGNMNDLLVLVEGDNPATTLHVRVWIGTACSMAGVSPVLNQTLAAFSHSIAGDSTALAMDRAVSWLDPVFTPSGALKYINVAGWMTVPLATEANPAGVALV